MQDPTVKSTTQDLINRITNERQRRSVGCLLGLAIGDALGTTNKFKARGSFEPVNGLVGGGPFNLSPGQWTDTSMALCLGASILSKGGFDAMDQMQRYVRWWKEGYLSSTGECFDIGNAICEALSRFLQSGDPWSGDVNERRSGNGSLMRLAPVAIAWQGNPAAGIYWAGESSRTTHASPLCIDACRFYAALLIGAIGGAENGDLLDPKFYPYQEEVEKDGLHASIQAVIRGSYWGKSIDSISSSGFTTDSLEAALWCFSTTGSFRDGVLRAANLGDDSDTVAAIYGMLAGAYYGIGEQKPVPEIDRSQDSVEVDPFAPAFYAGIGERDERVDQILDWIVNDIPMPKNGIPLEWIEMLHASESIIAMATELYESDPIA